MILNQPNSWGVAQATVRQGPWPCEFLSILRFSTHPSNPILTIRQFCVKKRSDIGTLAKRPFSAIWCTILQVLFRPMARRVSGNTKTQKIAAARRRDISGDRRFAELDELVPRATPGIEPSGATWFAHGVIPMPVCIDTTQTRFRACCAIPNGLAHPHRPDGHVPHLHSASC